MRAISDFNFEAGTSTFGWRAATALRTRVNISAMGSLVIVLLLWCTPCGSPARSFLMARLPTGLGHARNLAVERELAEAQAADAELAQERPRTPAAPAAIAMPALQLRRLRFPRLFEFDIFRDFGGCGHLLKSFFLAA